MTKDAKATARSAAEQLKPYQFKPGQSGNPNGRPKGTRDALGQSFIHDMYEAWQQSGKAAIARVIEDRPHEFIKAVAGILPKELNVKTSTVQELSDDELVAALAALRSAAALADAGGGGEAPSRH